MMDVTSVSDVPALTIARELRGLMRGTVSLPTDPDYAPARRIWNDAVSFQPALFAHCVCHEDVSAAVRMAQIYGLPLSVRGGGHDWAGRSLRHDGLVIDLTAMRGVAVDPQTRIATVAGGARGRDVIHAAASHDLVAVTGCCGDVGMAGLTLGGGYGLLSSKYGLALDNLLGADIVLANGEQVTASADENPDLYWALRGGGGNFGVVTSLRIRLHPVREALAGMILFPWADAHAVLSGVADVMASAPDELNVLPGIISDADGSPVMFLSPMWCGEPCQGARFIEALLRLGSPLLEQVGKMKYGDWLAMFDAFIVTGRGYSMRTRWLPELGLSVIADLVAAGDARTSPFSILAMHHLHGTPTRIAAAATAFGLRREHYMLEIIAGWDAKAETDTLRHEDWAEATSEALVPHALPGGYPNLLGPDDQQQIQHAYGENARRLLAVKRRFDPGNVFAATPLPF